ncbi:hypothetical protein Spa11_37880 [Botrimarina mediterranea]|uniref:Probable inorganic carbon transporter subunit DabA n=2 Tax=Botrimarina mediterranea TaxID=2528022 RepID=A0A518KCS6_9BACT|nr:hypothetical protein Spa11_37880 [Botrimarina mediterranea]
MTASYGSIPSLSPGPNMCTTIAAEPYGREVKAERPSDPHQVAAEALRGLAETIAPVWPLADYVAVNPYMGLTGTDFLTAREWLRGVSDCELLMPLTYYRQRFVDGYFGRAEIELAIDELVDADVEGAELITGGMLEQLLKALPSEEAAASGEETSRRASRIRSISAAYDLYADASWTLRIHEEIGKHCAAHYDGGQASWLSPWKEQSLYAAWRSAMRHDRRLEVLGLSGVRALVSGLPADTTTAVVELLEVSGVPQALWREYLLCLAYELPGWSAWTQYQSAWREGTEARVGDAEGDDLFGLVAMRLAYDIAVAKRFNFSMDISGMLPLSTRGGAVATGAPGAEALVRYALLRASEIAYRNGLLSKVSATPSVEDGADSADDVAGTKVRGARKLAQVAFCIDVRSERIRRHLEMAGDQIETIGFAGFFGLPFAFQRLGESVKSNQLPVLVRPQFTVAEHLRSVPTDQQKAAWSRRNFARVARKAWKRFQTASVSAFACVEATGLLFGAKLLRRVVGRSAGSIEPQYDGVACAQRDRLAPDLASLESQGLTKDRQADLAASILTGMGLRTGFARLVVFCGHGSKTENNPLAAGLDCGACGGHSGEPNARLAAQLLNNPAVRKQLIAKGFELSTEVHFLAGLHSTTTDEIRFFDLDLVPPSHRQDVEELRAAANTAANATRLDRLPLLSTARASEPFRRAQDWSEVRPEWGLTGNAAFIVGPRSLTTSISLEGRAFLHNYDHNKDPDGKVLEGILTAPMVVGSWINLQYYASTVDPHHFGSGSKTIHNVVGRFGVFSGNGGDLTTGVPWESVHDGKAYRHEPLRLLSVVAAPRTSITAILERHGNVESLVVNGWVQLVAMEDGKFYQLTTRKDWRPVKPYGHRKAAVAEVRSRAPITID